MPSGGGMGIEGKIGGSARDGIGIRQRGQNTLRVRMVLVLAIAWAGTTHSLAAGPFSLRADPYKATTSREARQNALDCIPLSRLDEEARAKVDSVLSDVAIFRRLPIRVAQCDPDMYLFLVRHPDVVTNIWEVLGLAKLSVRQTAAESFELADQHGTRGTAEILYSSPTTHLIYTEGSYEGPLLIRPVRGRTVLLLKTGYVLEPDGRYYITSRLDVFVRVEQSAAELLTKAFHPLIGKVADVNFTQTTGFVGSLSRTAEVNHAGMRRLAGKLTKVSPEVRERFAQLSVRVAEKAAKLSATEGSETSGAVARHGKLDLR